MSGPAIFFCDKIRALSFFPAKGHLKYEKIRWLPDFDFFIKPLQYPIDRRISFRTGLRTAPGKSAGFERFCKCDAVQVCLGGFFYKYILTAESLKPGFRLLFESE